MGLEAIVVDLQSRAADLRNFAEVLAFQAADRPNRVAFVFLDGKGNVGEQLTYCELDQRVRNVAFELISRGLSGERVLLLYPSGAEFVVALFACFHAGAVAVPIPYTAGKRTAERLLSICRDSRPAAALTLSTLPAARDLQSFETDEQRLITWIYTDLPRPSANEAPAPNVPREGLALLQYTSGSMGSPKGVMLTHGNLVANSAMIAQAFGHDENLRGVGWLPLFHDMGLVGHVLQPVWVGGLSVLMPPLSFLQRPLRWLEAITRWQATTSGGPSHGYELCLRALRDNPVHEFDLSSWKTAYCGAEPIRADALGRFAERFSGAAFRAEAFQPCYGLAEATLLVTAGKPGIRQQRPSARTDQSTAVRRVAGCGHVSAGGKVVIVDPLTAKVVADGEVGEIHVAGPHVGQGYWGQVAAGANMFGSRVAGHAEPFLRTGDLGFLRDGELFVIGRLKATIIVLGLKHAAEDIEATVSAADPCFAGLPSAATVVSRDDREIPILIQEVPASIATGDAEHAAQKAFGAVVREHGLKLDDVVLVRSGSLPRTSSGKIRRDRAAAMYDDAGFVRLNPVSPAPASVCPTVPDAQTAAA